MLWKLTLYSYRQVNWRFPCIEIDMLAVSIPANNNSRSEF